MKTRRETPNLLDPLSDIMGKSEPISNKTINQVNKKILSKEPQHSANVEETASTVNLEEEPKEKATFNLPIKLLRELEDRWIEMRRMSGSKRVSKTLMVEKAVEMALADFEIKQQESLFYCKLISNK